MFLSSHICHSFRCIFTCIFTQAANVSDFVGLTYQKNSNETRNTRPNQTPRYTNKSTKWNSSKSFLHHKLRLYRLTKKKDAFSTKEDFYQLYFQDDKNIYKTIIREMTKLGHYNLISLLWLISNIKKRKH